MNLELVDGQFGHGGLSHTLTATDWKYENLAPKGSAPFDWSETYDIESELALLLNAPNFSLPANDQGKSFSCGGQATSKYMEVLLARSTKKYSKRSAKYVYSQAFQAGGGSFGGDLMRIARNQGVSSEALCPSYDQGNPPSEDFMERPQDITTDARNDAQKAETANYAFLTDYDIDTLAQSVRDNHGAIIDMQGQNNGTWRSAFPNKPISSLSPDLWGHWLYVGKAKIINGIKYVAILNSWGSSVGEKGWQWISEDYINSGFAPTAMVMMFGVKQYQFTKDLYLGMTDADVYFLQKRLNQDSATMVAGSGVGSPGNESYYFGQLTQLAVIKFQKKYGIVPLSGYVGSKTRAVLNQ